MTDDIVAFIRARLQEDQDIAKGAAYVHGEPWAVAPDEVTYFYSASSETDHITRHDPARVLRGVEAKRRIVERHEPVTETWWLDEVGAYVDQKVCYTCAYGMSCNHCFSHDDRNLVKWPCPTMRDLAVEWSTHPDYRSEWA